MLYRKVLLVIMVVFLAGCNTVKTSDDYLPVEQRVFSQPQDQVFDEALSTLMQMKWHVTGSQKDSGLIQAQTPFTIWTTGDVVNVHVRNNTDGKTRVDVTSASNQAYDWGKNQENIQKFYSLLKKNLGS